MNVADLLEAIVDDFVDAIRDEFSQDEVRTVVRGDRVRPMPRTPAIWVVPEEAAFALEQYGDDEERWEVAIGLAALVEASHPEEAGRLTVRLAGRAMRAVLRDRTPEPGVIDILPASFNATTRPTEQNRNLFWADASVRVIFDANEGDESS